MNGTHLNILKANLHFTIILPTCITLCIWILVLVLVLKLRASAFFS